jgi:hypothetical protein
LYTFNGINVQPYWLIIVELILIQSMQRLYSRFACKKEQMKKTWYIALEISVLGEEKAGE